MQSSKACTKCKQEKAISEFIDTGELKIKPFGWTAYASLVVMRSLNNMNIVLLVDKRG